MRRVGTHGTALHVAVPHASRGCCSTHTVFQHPSAYQICPQFHHHHHLVRFARGGILLRLPRAVMGQRMERGAAALTAADCFVGAARARARAERAFRGARTCQGCSQAPTQAGAAAEAAIASAAPARTAQPGPWLPPTRQHTTDGGRRPRRDASTQISRPRNPAAALGAGSRTDGCDLGGSGAEKGFSRPGRLVNHNARVIPNL